MAIDPRFVVTSDLELYLVDKDSGNPLAGGIITFYSDVNRTQLKSVYQLTGSPPNYSYSPLPNPCVLSDTGTFQDTFGRNNIVPYYFPYTGAPADNTGIPELYYITVTDANGVPQFTRQGWPNFSIDSSSNTGLDLENFIPNGQFIFHNQINKDIFPPKTTSVFGSISIDTQAIAQGGWNFVRTNGGSSTFDNSFTRLSGIVSGINDFPRYAFNFKCLSFNANDSVRDLEIQWGDVYTFSGGDPLGTQDYTLFFNASSNDANTYTFHIFLTYYYGTGGSPAAPQQVQIGSVDIAPNYRSYKLNLAGFGIPTGGLGANDDDYVAISLRGPRSSWDSQFTDFALVIGNVNINTFPVQTQAEMKSQGIFGWTNNPTFDGSNLYLPAILTPAGMTWDTSRIGTIIADVKNTVAANNLLCDGSQYLTEGYSTLGIPYHRLWNLAIWDSASLVPKFGTGSAFATTKLVDTETLIIATNQSGLENDPVDGAVVTTFNFTQTAPASNAGVATDFGYRVRSNGAGYVTFAAKTTAVRLALFAVGTSGITVYDNYNDGLVGTRYAFYFLSLAASAFANAANPAKYFTFSTDTVNYYVWFFTASETDPAVAAHTGIRVNLLPTMTASEVAFIIANVISSHQTNKIVCTAASTFVGGAYFTFFSNLQKHVVWYDTGALTEPVVAGAFDYIKVTISASDTAAQVATKTLTAINSKYFAVPDLRGMFLRGHDPSATWDASLAERWFDNGLSNTSIAGSFEVDSIMSHHHAFASGRGTSGVVDTSYAPIYTPNPDKTLGNYGHESRPVNMTVNWVMVY